MIFYKIIQNFDSSVPSFLGIPATLNYISLDAPYEPSPKLTPYPSWAGNELGNCDSGLNTVYRIKADKCDRLWVLDVGTYGYGELTIVFPTKIPFFFVEKGRVNQDSDGLSISYKKFAARLQLSGTLQFHSFYLYVCICLTFKDLYYSRLGISLPDIPMES